MAAEEFGSGHRPLSSRLDFDNFQDAIAESFGGRKSEIPLEYKNRSAEYWPERLTMPVGITASVTSRAGSKIT